MREIYQAVVVLQMSYEVTAWFSPTSRHIPAKEYNQVVRELINTKKRAAILISGVFKGTAAAALNVELHLLPIRLQMQQITEETAIRIRTGPTFGCPRVWYTPGSQGTEPLVG
jgi:hypothetical protein